MRWAPTFFAGLLCACSLDVARPGAQAGAFTPPPSASPSPPAPSPSLTIPHSSSSGLNWHALALANGQAEAAARFPQYDGRGVTIAVIDTGVDYRQSALGGKLGAKVFMGRDFVDGDAHPLPDPHDKRMGPHGTAVTGLIAADTFTVSGKQYRGVAPAARILALRYNPRGDQQQQAKAALDWVIRHRVKYNVSVVNMTMFANAAGFLNELKTLVDAGVFFTTPAGNEASSAWGALRDQGLLVVGGLTLDGSVWSKSNGGSAVEMAAPAVGLPLLYPTPVDAGKGTSWASPQVAATGALLVQMAREHGRTFSPAQIKKILVQSGSDVYDARFNVHYRALNVEAALERAQALLESNH